MANGVPEDSEFPWLEEYERFSFPDPRLAERGGIVGVGGNLSPGMLISAYRQGIFPWYADGEPILWWSPDPRFVVFPDSLHIPKSLRKVLRRQRFSYTIDRRFNDVVRSCASVERPHEDGTWITGEMMKAYRRMHEIGFAHSFEAWYDGDLVGGLYGLSFGRAFFGESMFSLHPDASKGAFVLMCRLLFAHGFHFVDAQVYTQHLERLGAIEIPRTEFLDLLSSALKSADSRGPWSSWEPMLATYIP